MERAARRHLAGELPRRGPRLEVLLALPGLPGLRGCLAADRESPVRPAERPEVPPAAPRPRRSHSSSRRPDVQPCRLAEVAGLAALITGDGDDEVVAVDDDFGTRYAQTVDAIVDDRLRLVEGVTGGTRTVRRASGERYTGAALQIDAELRLGLLVPRQEHQQVCADQQYQEKRKVAGRVHRR